MSTSSQPTSIICNKIGDSLAHYPHAKRVGNLLFISGISARQKDNNVIGVTKLSTGVIVKSINQQTEAVIENIKEILMEAGGGGLENLVDITVFLTNMSDYHEFNKVYNKYFDAKTGPSRTTVEVKGLPGKTLLIEIKAIAYIPHKE